MDLEKPHELEERRVVHGPALGEVTEWIEGRDGVWIMDVTPKVVGGWPWFYVEGTCGHCGGPAWIDSTTGHALALGP